MPEAQRYSIDFPITKVTVLKAQVSWVLRTAKSHRSFSMTLLRKWIAGIAVAAAIVIVGSEPVTAQQKDVRMMLDWIIQGTHAPFFVAQQKGYFKDNGINVAIDPGKGAGNVAVSVASNVYNFGWVDLPTLIKFNAQNPSSPLIAVYISFDDTAMAVVTLKSKNYRKPADLNGARIAGGPGTAVHDTISILLKAANAENVKINWLPVQPQLFGPMVARGEADGTAGFTNSNIPALLEVGIKLEDIYPIRYADFGADLYGLALVTTKKYAEENPEVVRAMVKALNKGTIDTIKDPAAALQIMKARDPMMKDEIEKIRLDIALGLTDTKWVRGNGLSVVQPERLKKTIDAVVGAFGLTTTPVAEEVYTEKFLPPLAERKVQ
jgi:NitT/TauT family transport system substrate-binding protein